MIGTAPEPVTAEELLRLPVFAGESAEAVNWIATQMRVRLYEAGDAIVEEGDPATEFVVVLEGEIHFRRGTHDELLIAPTGQATGVLPFSRMTKWTGRGWAAQRTRIALMDASLLRELIYRAPILAQRLVTEMTDRTRFFTRMEEGSNRLLALGKLAAGLAHELNNPASVTVRSAARLREALTERRRYVLALRREVIPEHANQLLADLTLSISECATTLGDLDPLERSDLEADLAEWLESQGAPNELAAGLVDARVTVEQLRPLTSLVSAELMTLGLRILVADHEIYCLTREIEECSRRISDLVQAVKSYSYMDQNPVAEIDIAQGIEVTLRMFQHQIRHGVEVTRRFEPDLPRVRANGSALNQVWSNLIDNALDALDSLPPGARRELIVTACAEPGCVLVEIADNGPGIPESLQGRVFEPFFTTKTVGQGTGLGLDVVARIVRNHKGTIRFDSIPGNTVFQVRIPN